MRKSKREKEKEAAEAKRREEEERAAQAYADFVDEFEGEGSSRRKAGGSGFVRAGGEAAPAYSAPSGPSSDTTTRAKRMFEETIVSIRFRNTCGCFFLMVSCA
jgi:U2-associated protein SR140